MAATDEPQVLTPTFEIYPLIIQESDLHLLCLPEPIVLLASLIKLDPLHLATAWRRFPATKCETSRPMPMKTALKIRI